MVDSGVTRLKISVRVSDMAGLSRAQLSAAEAEAASILSKAGVDTIWLNCTDAVTGGPRDTRCSGPIGAADLAMNIVPRSMAGRISSQDSEFGFAPISADNRSASYGTVFYVFFHRAEDLSKRSRFAVTRILGVVVAHEIGHLLLGPDSHAPSGIMRATWERKDLIHASRGRLNFLPQQARLIRAEVERRMQSQADQQFRAAVSRP